MNNFIFWVVGLCIACYLAAVATYYVIIADCYDKAQKIAQIAVAWLIPILGAAIVIYVAISERRSQRRKNERSTLNPVLQRIPSVLFKIASLGAFSGGFGGAGAQHHADGADSSSYDGGDGGGGNGAGGDG